MCVRVAGSSTVMSLLAMAVTDRETDQNFDHFSTPPAASRPGGATRECSSDAECNVELGETCVRLYDGCRRGQCMCDPLKGPAERPTSRDWLRPWDARASNQSPPGYCQHVATRMFDKLDAKCDLC